MGSSKRRPTPSPVTTPAMSGTVVALVAAMVGGLGTGCATLRGVGGARQPLTGVWEGLFRSTLRDGSGAGDTRIERQAWRLAQKGGDITGFYVVELTMLSGDGRPYLCSREPRFTTLLRFEVRGRAGKTGLELDEIGDVRAKGTCRPSFRSPQHFRAQLAGDVLTLSDGDRRLALYRRSGAEAAAAAQSLLAFEQVDQSWSSEPGFPTFSTVSARSIGDAPMATATVNLEGLWVWEHRGAMPGGDEKIEREEWHLVQEGSKVSGYYDRAIHQISTDGHAYRCNGTLDFRVVTRYQINGEVRGNDVVLYEKGFEIVEGSPCDDGRRRLDAYQGEAGPGEIRLVWGVGTQVLKRTRPNVPTQRF
jgi:hypothetical protein